jgi:hypothetical protein
MKSFLIYKHLEPVVSQLTDDEAGQLFKALFEYENERTIASVSDKVKVAFTVFQIHLDKGRIDYEQRCEQNRANASKRKRSVTKRANINKNININKNKWRIDE